jgi:plastocyanin
VHNPADARAGVSSIIKAALAVGLLLGAAAGYWLYTVPPGQNATQTSSQSTSQSVGQTSATIPFATSSSGSSRYPALTFVTPPGAIAIIIPDGIDSPTARQLNITFRPVNVRVVAGVNSTIYFLNDDIDFTLGHIIQTTLWPADGKPFVFNSLPGEVTKVTLSTPGVYNYTCIWHPVWMQGSITVVSNGR